MIAFNDRKDCNQFELNELEDFFINQYKRKEETTAAHDGETSSDEEMSNIFNKKRRLPGIKKRKQVKSVPQKQSEKQPETLVTQKTIPDNKKEEKTGKGSAN